MSNANLTRWSGLSLLLAGIANALFWLLVIPIGTFAGAGAVQNSLWVPSQFLHTLAALLALFGLIGLYTWQGDKNGWLGLTGFDSGPLWHRFRPGRRGDRAGCLTRSQPRAPRLWWRLMAP